MASPPPNPSDEEGGTEFAEETPRAAAPQKSYVAPPASQVPSRLHYVALGAPGPSGIKQCFRTVKAARRVATLPLTPRKPRTEDSRVKRRDRDRHKRHACGSCDKRFSSPGKLSQHLLSHTGELPFSCNRCEKKFNSKFKLVRHSLIHSEARAFTCTECGKSFNRKDHLTNHVRVHNPVKKSYTCDRPDCRKSYTSLLSYKKHAALHSAEEGNLQCEICDETFATQQEIVYHLKVHTGSRTIKNELDKKFTCDYCERRFFTAKDVRRHLVVHTGTRDFLCPYCPQKFGRKDHLVRHVKNAHPEESWRSAAVGTSSDPVQEPPQESTSEHERLEVFQSPYIVEETHFDLQSWKDDQCEESMSVGGRTRVPSSDIIVEMPSEQDIKVEQHDDQLEIKLEVPDYPVVYMVSPPFQEESPGLPFMSSSPLGEPLGMLDPEPILLDPGEGPSGLHTAPGLSSQILRDLLEQQGDQTYGEEGRPPQRLPAFTKVFHTAQSSKPPPPPPPPH